MHPLRQKIRQLRTRLRQLLLLYGVSWTVAAMMAMAIVLGMADYLFRLHDPGIRVLSSLGLLAVAGWVAYRCLWRPLAVQLDEADIALRLRRQFPELGEQLACALEFLDQPDDEPTAGSPSLRHAVIDRAWDRAERLDFRTALNPRLPLRAAVSSFAVCLTAAILIVLDPLSARIATARLASPFAPPPWPRQTHLEFRDVVRRVARGQAFEVEVVNRGKARLPEKVQIEYRLTLPDGTTSIQPEPMRRRGTAVAFARRERVTRPFAYRAVGGDDNSMPWIEVDVVEPPAVESLSLRLSPPPYTGYPAFTSESHLRVLKGTTLAVAGRVNKPVKSLTLHLDGQPSLSAAIDADGMQFRIPPPGRPEPRIEATGDYWLAMVDREGITAESPHWEVHVASDLPPSVAIEQPSASLFVTPEAVVPVRVSAKDNLAVRRIALAYRLARGEVEREPRGEVVLFEGPPEPPTPTDEKPSPLDNPGDHRAAETQWAIKPLGLQPGEQLLLTAIAEDYQPTMAESQPVRLSVITFRELEDRIAAQQDLILAELKRALETQRRSRSLVRELEVRIGETRRVDRADVDHLQAAELVQRQVERELTGAGQSIPDYVAALLTDLDNNRVDSPDVRRRMQTLLAAIDDLRRDRLPHIRHELTSAIKSAQVGDASPDDSRPADPDVIQSLATAGEHQDRVVEAIEAMLKDLGRWDDYRRFYRDVGQLTREQEELGASATELGRRTMGRDPRDLPPAELADLRVLGAAQLDLARRLDRMSADMDQTARQLDATDPLAADTIALAVDEIRRLAISDFMRAGGGQLEQNRIGQAVASQHRVRESLHDVLNVLANRREHELERLAERLHEVEVELTDLGHRQAEVEAEFTDARRAEVAGEIEAAESQRRLRSLADRQVELAEAATRAARRLGHLQAQMAARTTSQAGDQMGTAARAAADGNVGEGAEHAGQAGELLEQARRQLAAQRRQTQAELAAEQLARLEDAVEHIHQAQQKVIEETRRIDQLVDSPDGFTRPLLASLQELVGLQQSARNETERLSRKLLGADAVQLVLDGAAGHMAEVTSRLQRQETGKETQAVARLASDRLAMLLEAFQTDMAGSARDPAGGGAGVGADADAAEMGDPLPAAEVKLIKLLQQDINRRTVELAASLGEQTEMSQAQRDVLEAIVKEQGHLADLTVGLLFDAAERQGDNSPSPPGEMPKE